MDQEFIPLKSKQSKRQKQKQAAKDRREREREILDDYMTNTDKIGVDFSKLNEEQVEKLLDMKIDYSKVVQLQDEAEFYELSHSNPFEQLDSDEELDNLGFGDESEINHLANDFALKMAEMDAQSSSDSSPGADEFSKSQLRKQRKKEKRAKKLAKALELKERNMKAREIYNDTNGGSSIQGLRDYLTQLNSDLRKFCGDSTLDHLILPPVNQIARKLTIGLATKYSFVCKVMGKGDYKTIILYRTERSKTPDNWNALVDRELNGELQSRAKRPPSVRQPRKDQKQASSRQKHVSPFVSVQPGVKGQPALPRLNDKKLVSGDVVGQGVKPISQTNVGHKMLMSMGWSPGEGLGAGGAVEPVVVKFKAERKGLGNN